MEHKCSVFRGCDGLELFRQSWHSTPCRAGVILVHGFGEHSGRYQNLLDVLVPNGFTVFGFDHRGHGRSPGRRGHVNGWHEYREDLSRFVDLIQQEAEGIPLFMYGHSMGGLMAVDYAIHRGASLRGVMLSSPALAVPQKPAILFLVGRILNQLVPWCYVPNRVGLEGLSRDPAVGQAYARDRLVHNNLSARLGFAIMDQIDWVQKHACELQTPVFLHYGGDDPIIPCRGSEELFPRLGASDKTLIRYDESRHEIHNELNKEEVLQNVLDWLRQRIDERTE